MCDSPENQTLQARLRSLEELTEFTENCQRQLNELFETLGWRRDLDNGSVQEPMEVCPYDPNHRVPSRSMERHKATCQLSQMGYSHEEQAEMYDTSLCYENASITSFTMDKHTQQQVILQARASAPSIRTEGLYSQSEYSTDPSEVPQNHKRAICDLTVADRLALFDHVTREASQQKDQAVATDNEDLYVDLVAKLKKGNDQNEHKSHLELMAEMRDYKRRRQSYRAKNVHNTKKSYTEVIREVINVHSVELSSQWKEEERKDEVRESKHAPHRRRSEDRRSASTESRQSHVSSRDGPGSHHKCHRSKDPSPEQSQERSREKESKKKRKRDSCSPDERPHERKKKKKKKKKKEEK
ncbi:U11/U12 small nuclear ribonucleoprotein 48 kDa protein-like [Salvelinus fontinalis]|uniref:U11/U12 small nuclear ribonucleoprotein 48 kDa protein-like n=1 Tax=Salvelinus fontinalis TaxID=8038 RepID=UPI0024852FD7|nr:U11/U12 small nuclear ribonucleoprotein 48 kDa protein-like [Salvelinus fontinalis]XP_055759432.1 U11/U12 small nuclear ribonucleoprotein 48 kDa protein-like [Salvelinus fontinalis]XP_055759434.1 U11/U12 small nuclear ribonucleoprotein 48 kDa protein-like [Salvelinus fontinalis]